MTLARLTRAAYLRWAVVPLLRCLPTGCADALAREMAAGFFELDPPLRGRIEAQLRRDLPAVDTREVARRSFEHVARFWAETLFIPRRVHSSNWSAWVDVADRTAWRKVRASPQPKIIVTGYCGNPVMAALALSEMLPPVGVVVDPASRHLIGILAGRKMRDGGHLSSFPGLVPLSQRDPSAIQGWLATGGNLMVILSPRRYVNGLRASFFGQPAYFSGSPARLAHRYAARLIWTCCLRTDRPFEFDMAPPEEVVTDRTAKRTTQSLVQCFEALIRRAPEQYLWTRAGSG
jgi:lauroyl/myristoyl acyltransferase